MTVRDIAREAGVSIATVSRVLNGDYSSVGAQKRERILEVARNGGYVLKRRARRKPHIALVVPQVEHGFFSKIAEEASAYCVREGLELILFSTRDDEEEARVYERILTGSDIEWVLWMGYSQMREKEIEDLYEKGKKVVLLDNQYYSGDRVPAAVYVDGEKGMHMMTDHLWAKGHRSIAYITGSKQARFNNIRHLGYTRSLFEKNSVVDPELTRFGWFTFESGYQCAKDLVKLGKKFTAVICENDLIAHGAIKALREEGLRVPEDISVTGFDDMDASLYSTPALTTMRQPVEEIIERSFSLFERMSDGESLFNTNIKLMPSLVERDSVRDIRKDKEAL